MRRKPHVRFLVGVSYPVCKHFYFNNEIVNYMRSTTYLTVFILTVIVSCEKFDNSNYLNQWLGEYEGTSETRSFSSDGESYSYRHVLVEVQRGDMDSTLNITCTYDDVWTVSHHDLKFSSLGHHSSASGAGGDRSNLSIDFDVDSMHYFSSQNHGIGGSSSVSFSIEKQ